MEFFVSISIHALREESDVDAMGSLSSDFEHFNPRPPRGERQLHLSLSSPHLQISIHALREESDPSRRNHLRRPFQFQSTPSARRATSVSSSRRWKNVISIHALREESDSNRWFIGYRYTRFQSTPSARRATFRARVRMCVHAYFNPRPPRGERRTPKETVQQSIQFQSTPSARRATK